VETVELHTANGVMTIAMNRPDRKNAINNLMWTELLQAFSIAELDDSVRVVVLTGKGGNFSSGADLSDPVRGEESPYRHQLIRMRRIGSTIAALHNLNKPTMAKVEGVAIGAGFALALGCDLVLASLDAVFSAIFSKRGLSPDSGSSWLLPRIVGLQKAKELAFFGDFIKAEEGVNLGFVNRVVGNDELDALVEEWSAKLRDRPPIALSMTKKLLNASFAASFNDVLESEATVQAVNLYSSDTEEAIRAFMEKRPPRFEG